MSFIPQEELQGREKLNLAPMIDFLFLMLMFFATLAITRVAVKKTDIDLVKITSEVKNNSSSFPEHKILNFNITQEGTYQWVTDIREYSFTTAEEIIKELQNQYQKGLLPKEKDFTHILLRIDKNAKWEPILQLIFSIRNAGFDVHPVYTEMNSKPENLTSSAAADFEPACIARAFQVELLQRQQSLVQIQGSPLVKFLGFKFISVYQAEVES